MNIDDDILIERFLQKELSKKALNLFLQRIESDLDFKNKVDFEKQLFESFNENKWNILANKGNKELKEYTKLFRSEEILELKKILRKEQIIYNKNTPKEIKFRFFYSVIAAIVLLFIVFFNNYNDSAQDLYTSLLTETELPSIISRGSQNELSKAQLLFENKDYEKALFIFNEALEDKDNLSGSIYIYTGVSQMKLNQFRNAENTFEELIKSDLLDSEKGHWFKALVYLNQNKIDECKAVLKHIIGSKSFNYKKAVALFDKL